MQKVIFSYLQRLALGAN